MKGGGGTWGLMAEFASADALLNATRAAREAGYARIEAYAPFPIDGLAEALGFTRNRVAPLTFFGALLGGLAGWFMQWYSAVVDYPLNIGGRPLNSWPMFVPVVFELGLLGGALAAFGAVILGSHLPDLAYPPFSAPGFDLAFRNRFFLCLRAGDPDFDPEDAARWLEAQQPLTCVELRS